MNDSIYQGCRWWFYYNGNNHKNECCTLLEIYKPLSFILYYLCIAYTEEQKHYNTGTKYQEKVTQVCSKVDWNSFPLNKKSRRITIMYSLNTCPAKVQINNTDCNTLSIVTH